MKIRSKVLAHGLRLALVALIAATLGACGGGGGSGSGGAAGPTGTGIPAGGATDPGAAPGGPSGTAPDTGSPDSLPAAPGPGGILVINIGGVVAGVNQDVLNVAGKATLGGTLQLVFSDDYTPAPGQRFIVINAAGGLSGGFVNVSVNKSLAITTAQDANSFTVIVN